MPFYLNVAKVLFRDRCVEYILIYTIGPTTAANNGHFNITIRFSSFEVDLAHINIYEENIQLQLRFDDHDNDDDNDDHAVTAAYADDEEEREGGQEEVMVNIITIIIIINIIVHIISV